MPRRLYHKLGNLLWFGGMVLLLCAGANQVQIAYYRYAARGDNDLPAPRLVMASGLAGMVAAFEATTSDFPPLWQPAQTPAAAPDQGQTGQPSAAPTAPSDGAAVAVGSAIRRVVIPSIDVDAKAIEVGWRTQQWYDGRDVVVWEVAEYAVGHHKGTANPGEAGNIVLAGHVGGHGEVFRDLIAVEPGAEVILHTDAQEHRYIVRERLMLEEELASPEERARNARYIEPTESEVVTLVTCWPPRGPRQYMDRIVVQAVPAGAHEPAARPGS